MLITAARAVRVLAAAVLLTAAVMKTRAGPVEGWGLAAHELLIACELWTAMIFVTGVLGRRTAVIGAGVFLAFAVVAGTKLWAGAASCGCFGRAKVPPAATVVMDLLLAGAFLAVRGQQSELQTGRWRWLVVVAGSCVLAGHLVTAVSARPNDPEIAALGDSDGRTVYFRPEAWPGKPLSIARQIKGGSRLEHGRWVILIFQDGCTTCEAALPNYRIAFTRSRLDPSAGPQPRCALIGLTQSNIIDCRWADLSASLPTDYAWFATTPIVIGLSEGVVVYQAAGLNAVDPDRVWRALALTGAAR